MNGDDSLSRSRLEVGKPHLTYMHTRESGRPENVIWLEERLDDEWVAAYLFTAQNGGHVLAEARLFPYEQDGKPGEWSRSAESVPSGGIPSTQVRDLHTDRARKYARAIHEWWEDSSDDPDLAAEHLGRVLARFHLNRRVVMSSHIARRRRRLDSDVARGAAAYAGDGRIKAAADALCCSESNAYKVIADARSRGFLEDGELTEAGRRMLGDLP